MYMESKRMKDYAKRIVRAGVPIKRSRDEPTRVRKEPVLPEQSVYKRLDSWAPPERTKDKTKSNPTRPRGRPRIPREKRRSVPFSFLMSPEEWEIFDSHIKELGCTAASFARDAIFKELGQDPPPRPLAEGRAEKCRRSSTKKGASPKK